MNGNVDEKADGTAGGAGIAARELLQKRLRALPDTPPPHEVWRRIERQARAEGLLRGTSRFRRARWLSGTGLAAAVALAVLYLPGFVDNKSEEGSFPTEPAYTESGSLRNLDALMVRSRLLERNLRALPAEPRVMRAGTAATIGNLEDRIAAIDYALNDPQANLSSEEVEVFWQERVRLMDSLVRVRYAQAQSVSF
jgi:hypothetical protein